MAPSHALWTARLDGITSGIGLRCRPGGCSRRVFLMQRTQHVPLTAWGPVRARPRRCSSPSPGRCTPPAGPPRRWRSGMWLPSLYCLWRDGLALDAAVTPSVRTLFRPLIVDSGPWPCDSCNGTCLQLLLLLFSSASGPVRIPIPYPFDYPSHSSPWQRQGVRGHRICGERRVAGAGSVVHPT